MHKNVRVFSLILVIGVAAIACSEKSETPHLNDIRQGFLLADGVTPISNEADDDYNPILLVAQDGTMGLIFGSNRSCTGCNAGKHNLFVATSTAPFTGGSLPTFNDPKAITVSSSPLNRTTRIHAAAYVDASDQIILFNTNASGTIQQGTVDAGPATMTTPTDLSDAGGAISATVVSVTNSGGVRRIAYIKDSSLYLTDLDSIASSTPTALQNTNINSNSSVAIVPNQYSGLADSYMYTNWDQLGEAGGYVYSGDGDFDAGEVLELNIALDFEFLGASFINSFVDDATSSTALTFSAGDSGYDGNQDLYVVTSHNLADLYYLAVPTDSFFNFSDTVINVQVTSAGAATALFAQTTLAETTGYEMEATILFDVGGGTWEGELPIDPSDGSPRTVIIWDDLHLYDHPYDGTVNPAGTGLLSLAPGAGFFSPCQGGQLATGSTPYLSAAQFVQTNSYTYYSSPTLFTAFPPRLAKSFFGSNAGQFASNEKFTASPGHVADDLVSVVYSSLVVASSPVDMCNCNKTLNLNGAPALQMYFTDTNFSATGGSCGSRFLY